MSTTQTITSDTDVSGTTTRTILSSTDIKNTTIRTTTSNSQIKKIQTQSLTSDCRVRVNSVVLKMYKESDLVNEIGTTINPIIFYAGLAGQTTQHPNNPFLLYNDKDGTNNSTDAKSITVEVLEMSVVDELVGTSDGSINQVFNVAYPPIIQGDPINIVRVRVDADYWSEDTSFLGHSNTDTVFVVDYTLGTITFGNNISGMAPANGKNIYVTYSPNTTRFGKEARDDGWLGIQSADVDSHSRTVLLVPSSVIDSTHIQLFHIPLINSNAIQGVWLQSDPNRLSTNYFTGGSYNDSTGIVILGTSLPGSTTIVLVDYKYKIANDGELSFTQLSRYITHTFLNPIPSTNAKKLNLQVAIPANVSPTNGVRVKFRLRITYTEY